MSNVTNVSTIPKLYIDVTINGQTTIMDVDTAVNLHTELGKALETLKALDSTSTKNTPPPAVPPRANQAETAGPHEEKGDSEKH